MIETKDILDWCFTLGALDFGVFGFLYSIFTNGMFLADEQHPAPPPIVESLKRFCMLTFLILAVLTILAAVTSYNAGVNALSWSGFSTWAIIVCFAALTAFSGYIVIHTMG